MYETIRICKDARGISQPHFICVSCGYKRNADYVGSVNIRDRRSIPFIDIYTPYKSIRGLVRDFYTSYQFFSTKPKHRLAVSNKSGSKEKIYDDKRKR